MNLIRIILSEVAAYCRSDGYLLTLAPDDDIAAYRQWSIEEVLRQHDGMAPTPWPRYAAEHGLQVRTPLPASSGGSGARRKAYWYRWMTAPVAAR